MDSLITAERDLAAIEQTLQSIEALVPRDADTEGFQLLAARVDYLRFQMDLINGLLTKFVDLP